MGSRNRSIQHVFAGGWATDRGSNHNAQPSRGVLDIPFLTAAENVVYELNGAPRKSPGATKLNATAVESGAVIKGIFDFWLTGTAGAPTQKRIIHAGTKILKDDADGTFDDLFTGLTADKIPSYAVLNDLLVMAQTGTDVPRSWDGSTAQNLAGTPPNFSFVVEHKNRLWAAGVVANGSRLYYSALLDPADWIGAGSGTIDISPDDGDSITGLRSHKGELWVFKGPYKGSIHRITGSSPTGGDPFARRTFVVGLGAAGHNSIFPFRGDIGFIWSDGSVHSLNATSAFGDFNASALSGDIQSFLRSRVKFSRLNHAWAANYSDGNYVLFSLTVDSATDNNYTLMMDYRFSPPRWSAWPAFTNSCIAEVVDSADSNRRIIMAGGNDGFVRKYNQSTRTVDASTAIAYKATTPFLSYGSSLFTKTVEAAAVDIKMLNNGLLNFSWRGQDSPAQTKQFRGGTGVFLLDTGTLDSSRLGEGDIRSLFVDLEEGGEFRQVQYSFTQNGVGEDVELHGFGAELSVGARSTEN